MTVETHGLLEVVIKRDVVTLRIVSPVADIEFDLTPADVNKLALALCRTQPGKTVIGGNRGRKREPGGYR